MTDERVIHDGQSYNLAALIKHYRNARRAARLPEGKDMYRDLLRCVIREARQQRAAERMAA